MSDHDPNPIGVTARPVLDDGRGRLAQVLEAVPLPALVVDAAAGRLLHANAAARGLGLDTPRSDEPALPDNLAVAAAAPDGAEIPWHTPERMIPFRVFARPLPPADGTAGLVLLTFLDLTRQRQTEAELIQAVEARNEFFSVATHELKDPLFAVQLSVQLLRLQAERHGPPPAYVVNHLEVSQRQVERLARLIENLLDVSRIANRRLQLDLEALDLAELANEVVGRFQEKARAAGAPLGCECPGPVIGYFDRLKVEQVLSNLLSNALKYGAGRPVVVRVRGDVETVALEVEDRGIGIAPEDQDRVFQRFERVAQAHKRESLGLGLYIVRSLAQAHGGTVTLRSAAGEGSTFTVTLPRKRVHAADPGDAASVAEP